MAEDNVQANIRIDIDTSDALVSIKNLQRQISAFHTSMANGSAANAAAASNFQKTLIDNINATKKFSASVQTVRTTTETFTNSLEKNKLSLNQYFRYAGGASKSFGRLFATEFDTINKVARERVKDLQTQYIKMGRDASGAMKAIAVRPLVLDMDNLATKTAIAAQRQQLLNQLLKQGSTNLLNFGKNTQWAGRQLMVGFTIPLSIFGATAAKSFMTIEEQAIRFRRVYGDLMTDSGQTEAMLDSIKELATEFTKYGVAVDKTMGLAASAAAQGKTGADLTAQVAQATRLSILGQVEQQQALDTTISVTNAFGVAAEDLASKIDFLNAVENQTVTSIEDLTIAIPKAGPVVKQLGGDVEDLSFFLTAMKEGGINASEGANALKSGLASLINPTEKASAMLAGFGININGIVESNKGDVKGIVIDFATALDKLDPLGRARAIEQLFGKFQFSRLSTLFQNVIGEGTQAQRVLELAATSSQGLADLSARELGKVSESSMFKFKKSIEDIKVALAPIGETFLKLATPVIEFGTKILNAFNSLDERTKNFVAGLVAVVGGIGPILLMTFGLLANGVANIIKGFTFVKNVFNGASVSSNDLGSQISYMTSEQVKAASVAASLDQVHGKLTQTFTAEANAIGAYVSALQRANTAAAAFNVPAIGRARPAVKMAGGGMVRGPGGPTDDSVPADLSNGEAVIDAATVKKNPRIIGALFAGKKIQIPGYAENNSGVPLFSKMVKGFRNATMYLPETMNTEAGGSGKGTSAKDMSAYIKKATDAGMAPLMASMAQALGLRLNDPKLLKEWEALGTRFADSASEALNASGKEFVKDQDIEDVVVPALREAAKGISVGGKLVGDALDRTLDEFRTAGPIGAQSGALGGEGRKNLGGSYKGSGATAQKYALNTGNELFKKQEVDSRSLGKKNIFQTFNESTQKWETATMSHIQKSVNMTVEKLKAKIAPYLGTKAATIIDNIDTAVIAGFDTATKRKSPPREAIDAGQDYGNALNSGAKSKIDDANAVGTQLGNSVVSGANRASRRVQGIPDGSGGMRIVPVPVGSQSDRAAESSGAKTSRRASAPQTNYDNIDLSAKNAASSLDQVAKVSQSSKLSMLGLNNALSVASLGVSGLSGAAMMFGDANNKAVTSINALSTGLFGLSSVMQIFGGGSLQGFLGKRLKKAKIADRATRAFSPGILGAGSQAAASGGLKSFGAMLLRGALFVKNFIGPIGLAIGAVSLLAVGIKFVVDEQEKQRRKIEGLGDAALLTKDKLETLGSIFGVTISKSPLERATVSAGPMAKADRQQVDLVKSSQEFKDRFATDIKSLSESTAAEAKIALESIAIQLEGSGFAKEQIAQVVFALQEESKQTSFKIDFKSISLNEEVGREKLGATAKTLVEDFNAAFDKNLKERKTTPNYMGVKGTIINTDEFKKQSVVVSKTLAGTFSGIANAFSSGVIDSKEFEESIANVSDQIRKIPKPQQLSLMNSVLSNMDSPLATAAKGVTNLKDKFLLLEAAMLGVNTLTEFELSVFQKGAKSTDGGAQRAYSRIKLRLIKTIKSFKEAFDSIAANALGDPDGGGGGGGGSVEKSAYEKAVEQITAQTEAIANQTKAFNKLKAAGYSTEKAFEIAKDPILAAALASTRVGSKEWKLLTQAIKLSTTAAEAFKKVQAETIEGATQQFTDAYGNVTERFSALQEGLQVAFEKANKADNDLISSSQSNIAGLEYTIDDLNASLDDMQLQEDEINKKYDKRIEALDDIQSANEAISRQQESQLDISSALSKGDMSSAARAIQALRAENAKTNIENQRSNLEKSRASEIGGLKVNGKTKVQIDAEILSLQKQIKKIEEESLEPAQNRIRLAEEKLQKDISNLTVLNKTKTEWDLIASNIRIAKTQTDIFTKALNESVAAAKNLELVLKKNTTGIPAAPAGPSDSKSKLTQSSTNWDAINYLKANNDPVYKQIMAAMATVDKYEAVLKSKTATPFMIQSAKSKIAAAETQKNAIIKDAKAGKYASGGNVSGPGTGTSDSIPAWLSNGEYVINADAVKSYGVGMFDSLNAKKFAKGGNVNPKPKPTKIVGKSAKALSQFITNPETGYKNNLNKGVLESFVNKNNISAGYEMYRALTPYDLDEIKEAQSKKIDWKPRQVKSFGGSSDLQSLGNAASKNGDVRFGGANDLSKTIAQITAMEDIKGIKNVNKFGKLSKLNQEGTLGANTRYRLLGSTPATANSPGIMKFGAYANSFMGPLGYLSTLLEGGKAFTAKKPASQMYSMGGMVSPKYFSEGGLARGTDIIPSMLTPGEFVINKSATRNLGVDKLTAMNNGSSVGESVYNYNLSVNMSGSNLNADDVARKVMTQIKQIDSQRIRGNTF